jgi:iron complex outermembrane receptor protein
MSRHRSARIATVVSGILRALPICAPIALFDGPVALAEGAQPALTADIPAEPLAPALEAFARQTGLQLVYVSGVVRDQRSHAVSAGLGAAEALGRMLKGTGLTFEYLTPRSVHILTAVAGPPKQTGTNVPAAADLEEVIVTANRREENLQKVPMTIEVLTGATLAELNTTTFDDFVKYLPAVTSHGVGPGQNNIYVRGLATVTGGIQSSGLNGPFPNVAVYLDEQSVQLPNRNLDIYAADLERVEILEGPQGTMFGAGAEAGVVRYLTNKPKLDVTEAMVNAGYATTAHGDQSSNLDATLNVPIIPGKLAVRGVIYNEKRGGYIDNLPATFARSPTDPGISYFFNGKVPTNSVVINNFNIAAKNINPVTYQGIRVEALYRFNEDWDALLAQSYQSLEADGVFTEMAANSLGERLPDLSVQLFNPSYDNDRFENTALTISGRVGALKLVYAGSYLVRNVEQVQDYTQYSRNVYADYYQCVNPGPTPATAQCFTPSATWHEVERNTHQSHELRLTTPDDWRIRGIGGLFYEKYRIQEQVDWFYLTALPYFQPIGPPTGYYTLNGSPLQPSGGAVYFDPTQPVVFVPSPATSNNPNVRPPGDGFFNDITRGYQQKAAYASVDADLIPTTLTLTAGTRYSSTETSEVGSSVGSSGGCDLILYPTAPNPCVNHSFFHNIDAEGLKKTYSGFNSRANLSWRVTEDALLYYTWSQGFRAGGFNRAPIEPPYDSPLLAGSGNFQAQARKHRGYVSSLDFAPDSLINNEFGWKTRWLDRHLQWDGAVYLEEWNQAQTPESLVGLFGASETVNGGNYRVRGLDTTAVARVAAGLTIEAGAVWNHSALVKQGTLRWRDGTSIDFGALRDSQNRPVQNPSGALGAPLAGAPPFKGNVRARYELMFNGYEAFVQVGAEHQSHSLATTYRSYDPLGNSLAYDLPAFTTYDAALGAGRDAWLVQFYGENLTDTRAQLYANYSEWYKAITVNRPRTIGLRFRYTFSGK